MVHASIIGTPAFTQARIPTAVYIDLSSCQVIHNTIARVFAKQCIYCHNTPVLVGLQCLQVFQLMDSKLPETQTTASNLMYCKLVEILTIYTTILILFSHGRAAHLRKPYNIMTSPRSVSSAAFNMWNKIKISPTLPLSEDTPKTSFSFRSVSVIYSYATPTH